MDQPTHAAGLETMSEAIGEARRYYAWVYATLRPHLGRRILEIGPGYGRLAEKILQEGRSYWAIDTNEEIMARLRGRLALEPGRLIAGDVTASDWIRHFVLAGIDTILSMNVLEHIEDDEGHLRDILRAAPGGRLVLLVPAMPRLYGSMDRQAGHFRRYAKRGLTSMLVRAGLRVREVRYFNALGAIIWFVSARVLQLPLHGTPTNRLIELYDRLANPVARIMDPVLRRRFGQSLLAVADIP